LNCYFENVNGSNFDFRSGVLEKNNFKKCNFFSSCFRGSMISENNYINSIFNNCDIKNIIFKKNIYEKTVFKFSNLFKSKFLNENLLGLDIQDCNTFLCVFKDSVVAENLNLDKYTFAE
jgi:uncharacterized protein YjbI with pentapeptide repeats